MSWADYYVKALQAGQVVAFRPRGHSMRPHILSGQLVTVEPVGTEPLLPREIVLARVRGADYLHFIQATRAGQVLIANAHGHENGWTAIEKVFGRVIKVEP